MPFSTDQDLKLAYAGIMDLLPADYADWSPQRGRAEALLLDDLDRLWFRKAAAAQKHDWRAQPLDPARLGAAQLKPLSVLKTLECVFEFVRALHPQADGYERAAGGYREQYLEALRASIKAGLDYDWSGDGTVDSFEKSATVPTGLVRA